MKHQPMLRRLCLGYRSVQVLAYIRQEIEQTGIAPSYDMIADAVGMNCRSKVCDVVARLERRGLLSRVGSGRVRRIRLNGGALI